MPYIKKHNFHTSTLAGLEIPILLYADNVLLVPRSEFGLWKTISTFNEY